MHKPDSDSVKKTTTMTLRLGNDTEEARAAIAAAVDSLLEGGKPAPTLTITLGGDTLPAQVISSLISGLRRLREAGGAISLVAEAESVRSSLRVTGLDRVFALPIVPRDDTRPFPAARRFSTVLRAAVAGIVAIAALSGGPARAQTLGVRTTDPAVILERVNERDPNLSSYQSRLHVDVQLHSFPFLHQKLEGSTYFKRPANYEVVFDRVPSYAKGFEKLYTDIGDASSWEKRFVITYDGERQFENRKDIELRLVQRVRGMIDHENVLIDRNAWTIDQLDYHYYNGGVISMKQHFSSISGHTMLASQQADINIPHVRGTAYGTYTDYQTNVAIDDAVFAKKK